MVINCSDTQCGRNQPLHGNDNDYLDTDGKFSRLLTDFKGTISLNKELGWVYK